MIDPDLISKNPVAREGLKMLAISGVLREQQARLRERIIHGDDEEELDSLVAKVKEFRRNNGMLESLQQLGEEYQKETDQ
jgi:hypothetical protein